ncbi:MAG: hypothetical protein ACYDHD_06785 [Vulcanimicrobiaceae bacterium]
MLHLMKRTAAAYAATFVSLCAFASAAPLPAATPPSATAFYVRAVATMDALPQPAYATYTMLVRSEGGSVKVAPNKGKIELTAGTGPNTTQRIPGAYRGNDATVSLFFPKGKHVTTGLGVFMPTWDGAYAFMQRGYADLGPTPKATTAAAAPPASPKALPAPDATLKTIAIVKSIGSGYYRVQDRGAASCPDGAPGHALHLIAWRDPQTHPLTDVIVDLHSMRFCMMRFSLPTGGGGPFGATGFVELHFRQSGAYWMESASLANITARVLGIAMAHMIIRMNYNHFTFPSTLPAALFVVPKAAPTATPQA